MTATAQSAPRQPLANASLAAQIQRRTALQRAAERRAELAQLHNQLRSGQLSLSEVVLSPPTGLGDRMIWQVLLAAGVPAEQIGELNSEAIKDNANVNLAAPLAMISTRQRRWLAQRLAAANL